MTLTPGTPCTVNGSGDLAMDAAARPFIGAACVVVKITKGGLVLVALPNGKQHAFPRRNIDIAPG